MTDAAGNVTATYEDVLGQHLASEEHHDGRVLTTRYEYDLSGQLTAIVDAANNRSLFTYDLLGRRVEQRVPDTGWTEFSYDPAGNLFRKVTPNLRELGAAISYAYDYNRLKTVDHPLSADLHYTYGDKTAANNGRNRVIRIEDEAGTEELAYGKLGEVVRSIRVVDPLKPGDRPRTFETRFDFDAFGRMLSLRYPDGERAHLPLRRRRPAPPRRRPPPGDRARARPRTRSTSPRPATTSSARRRTCASATASRATSATTR